MSLDRTAQLRVATLFVGDSNPRRSQNATSLGELVASIRQQGVLVPLLVRPHDTDDTPRYEVIAGSRRLAAAREIGLGELPCIVRTCDDAEARTLALVDNLQREDVHPLEEADGYADLMAADPRCTLEVLAAQVGRSVTYLRRRLRLRALIPPVREACASGEITIAHAEELAGLHPDVQHRALEEGCFDDVLDWDADDDELGAEARKRELQPVRELKHWIRRHTKIDIAQPETIELFPQLADLQAEPEVLLEISTAMCRASDVPAGVLPPTKWRPAEAKRDQCDHRQRAVVVHAGGYRNDGLGEIRWVCAHRKCETHFPPKPKAGAAATKQRLSWEEQAAQRKQAQAVYDRIHAAAIDALAAKTKNVRLDDTMLVDLLAERVSRDELSRIARLVGGAITLKTFGQALVLIDALAFAWPGAKPDLAKLCKAHGVDLKKVEKGLPDPMAPAKAASANTKSKKVGGKTPAEKSIARRSKSRRRAA